jgi:hypothetical protein
MMHMVLAILGICTALSQGAVAATRLGLHVTQEELNIWRQRITDNVNTINGFTYQSIYQNRILDGANIFKNSTHPGADGFWAGQTSASCLQADTLEPHGPRFFRGTGIDMLRSAFVFLLTGDVTYADPIRTELVRQTNTSLTPGTNWADNSRWCTAYPPTGGSYPDGFEIVPWVIRLLLAYDYLDAGGYTGFTAAERTQIQNWFVNAATYWHTIQQITMVNVVGYPGLYNTPPDYTCSGSWCNADFGPLYYLGPHHMRVTYLGMNGQSRAVPPLEMVVGIKFNHATHKDNGIKAALSYLKLGIWGNGDILDYIRWQDRSTYPYGVGSMWQHSAFPLGATLFAIDILARTGDTSLYVYNQPTLVPFGGGTPVGIITALRRFARLANKTDQIHAGFSAGDVTSETLMSWDTEHYYTTVAPFTCGRYDHFLVGLANLYYNDPNLTTAMTHNTLCANSEVGTSPRGCADDQYGGCFSGTPAFWPDLPFMYGNMQGQVNPYVLTAASVVKITSPTTSPTYATSLSPLTTLAGTADDPAGIASVAWSCDVCGSGAATGTTSWSVPSITLQLGPNVITVTATKVGGGTLSDQITITLGVTVTTDSTYGGYNTAVIDDGVINASGGTATTWASAESSTADHWIVIDFGTTKSITSATLHWAYNVYQQKYMASNKVDVQYWNGSAYQTVATMNYAGDVPSTTVNFPAVSTSRIRFYQGANQGNPIYPGLIWLTEVDYDTQTPTLPSPPSDLRVISAQ